VRSGAETDGQTSQWIHARGSDGVRARDTSTTAAASTGDLSSLAHGKSILINEHTVESERMGYAARSIVCSEREETLEQLGHVLDSTGELFSMSIHIRSRRCAAILQEVRVEKQRSCSWANVGSLFRCIRQRVGIGLGFDYSSTFTFSNRFGSVGQGISEIITELGK